MASRILSFTLLMVVLAPFASGAERHAAPIEQGRSQGDSQDDACCETPGSSCDNDRSGEDCPPCEDDELPQTGGAPLEIGLRPNMVDSAERVVRSSGSSRHLLAAFRPITRFGILPRAMNLRLERVLAQVRSLAPTMEVEAPASRPHAPPASA